MEFNSSQMYQLMSKFREFKKTEVLIMDYLMQTDVAEITYSELAKVIGKKIDKTRNAILNLEERGIVHVVRVYYEDRCNTTHNPMKECFIVDNWMDNLLNYQN